MREPDFLLPKSSHRNAELLRAWGAGRDAFVEVSEPQPLSGIVDGATLFVWAAIGLALAWLVWEVFCALRRHRNPSDEDGRATKRRGW